MKAFFVLLATGAAMLAQTPPPAKSAAPATKSAAPAPKTPAVNPLLQPATLKAIAPATFQAKFTTTKGDFTVLVHRDWSPLGADRFYNLIRAHFFDGCAFFRNLPGFIVQFGMSPDPKVSAAWEKATIKDDPMKPGISNRKGTLVYAKPEAPANARTTQLFINTGDNTGSLDPQGFSPFAEVTEGMDVVLGLYAGYGQRPDQGRIAEEGRAYLDKNFPSLDKIKSATVVPAAGAAAPATKSTSPAAKSTSAPPKK
jgi:peptidyl-prolyl cis-trans isomerase A (cyclophilin A)